jgi:hypothetical protein
MKHITFPQYHGHSADMIGTFFGSLEKNLYMLYPDLYNELYIPIQHQLVIIRVEIYEAADILAYETY